MNSLTKLLCNGMLSREQDTPEQPNVVELLATEIDDAIDLLRSTTDEVLIEYALLNLEQVKHTLQGMRGAKPQEQRQAIASQPSTQASSNPIYCNPGA